MPATQAGVDLWAKVQAMYAKRGEPVDATPQPVCNGCRDVDRAEQAEEYQRERNRYRAARSRLETVIRPDAVERDDWTLVRKHAGEDAVKAIRARRDRPSRKAEGV